MKGAKPDMIRSPFFQFYKTSYDVNDVNATKYLLYGVLGDHFTQYRDCEYKFNILFLRSNNYAIKPNGFHFFHTFMATKMNFMRKTFLSLLLISASGIAMAQNVGIGTVTPNAAALLHLNSTNKGILIPQVAIDSLHDILSVPSPALWYAGV